MKVTRTEKLIIIDDCRSDLLDNLDGLAFSRLSGDGALLIHTHDLLPGERTKENIQLVVDAIKGIGGAQLGFGDTAIPDAFILLRR